jgi:hypothetical protein
MVTSYSQVTGECPFNKTQLMQTPKKEARLYIMDVATSQNT